MLLALAGTMACGQEEVQDGDQTDVAREVASIPPRVGMGGVPLTIGGDWPRLDAALYVPSLQGRERRVETPNVSVLRETRLAAGGGADWRTLISKFFPESEVERAMAVIHGTPNCPNGESGGDPNAYNAGNYGGFQINYASHREKLVRVTGVDDPTLLFDPEVNVQVGYLVWLESGGGTWLPWSCRP